MAQNIRHAEKEEAQREADAATRRTAEAEAAISGRAEEEALFKKVKAEEKIPA